MNTQHFFYNAAAALLKITLVLALSASVWNIYRHLPDDSDENAKQVSIPAETALQIILRGPAEVTNFPTSLPVKLYPIDITAAQNEFLSERRPGKRLEDFLAERMGNRAPVESKFDDNGQVTVTLKSGPWWIHATLPGELNIEWHLRVNVSGQRQTVELTTDNAYMRTKSF